MNPADRLRMKLRDGERDNTEARAAQAACLSNIHSIHGIMKTAPNRVLETLAGA